jgi:GAF domain-containing protein
LSAYARIEEQFAEIAGEGGDAISILANASALLKLFLDDVNWAGFYLMKDGVLKLGPFQGKPAIAEIRPGDGVCGTAVTERATQIVSDVHVCTNHIVCDPDSASEIAVPIMDGGEVLGVIDIDSPRSGRFDDEDRRRLERFANVLLETIR